MDLPNRFPVETNLWQTPIPLSVEAASGEKAKLLDDGSALFAGKSPDKDSYTFVVNCDLTGINSLRIEALTDETLPSKGPGRVKHGNFVLTEITVSASPTTSPDPSQSVKLVAAIADVEQKNEEFEVTV